MKKIYILALLLGFGISSCTKPSEQIYSVEYNIGCSDCTVVYVSDQSGTQTSEYHKTSSWKFSFNAKKGQEVLLMAYNTSSAPQGVTATMKLNNQVLQTRTTYCPISGISFVVDTI